MQGQQNEIERFGVYDPSEVASKTCDIDLFVWGRRRNMMTKVIYGTKLTAKITKISPNWGSVVGETTITITGVNFSSRKRPLKRYREDH